MLLLFASAVEAQVGVVFNRTGSGARAAGMANAFIGISDDGTAASWNPAGLGQLRKPEISIVTTISHQFYGSDGFRARDGLATFTPLHSGYSRAFLDFGSLAVPMRIAGKPVTLQAAWRRLYTLDFRENGSVLRTPLTPQGPAAMLFESNADLSGGISLVSIAGAVKLTPRLAFGGSLNLWRGEWTEASANSETILDPPAIPRFVSFNQRTTFRGRSLSLGLLLTYPRWSVGLLRQGAARGDFSAIGTSRASFEPAPVPDPFEGQAELPQGVGAGVAWRPVPRWTVALDLMWDQWSRSFLLPKEGPRVDLFNSLPAGLSATRDTLSANAGAECLFHGEGFVVPVRFGVAWEPQGPRNPYTRDPVNFVMLAAGTGYNTNSLKFDAAFQYRWSHFFQGADFSIDRSDLLLPRAVGERTVREWRVKVSVIVRVTDTEKLGRTLRKIFGGGESDSGS